MLEVILGGRGHGKSTYATYRAIYDYKIRGKAIYSNYNIKNIPHKAPTPGKEMRNASVVFDEAYIAANARLSMSRQNRLINYLVFQSRKMSVDLYFIAQLGRTIDILIKESADKITLCKALYRDEGGLVWVKDHDTDTIEAVSIVTYDQNNDRYHSYVLDPAPFFEYFDTNERIPATPPPEPPAFKSKAERDHVIIQKRIEGESEREIAKELGISRGSVRNTCKKYLSPA